MHKGPNTFCFDRLTHIRAHRLGVNIFCDNWFTSCQHLTDISLTFCKLHDLEGCGCIAMAHARYNFSLFLVPRKNHTSVSMKHIYGNIHQRLENLI